MYVYIRSEENLWTVGFYDPKGHWNGESDHSSTEDAAARVSYLNGGSKADFLADALNSGDGTYRP